MNTWVSKLPLVATSAWGFREASVWLPASSCKSYTVMDPLESASLTRSSVDDPHTLMWTRHPALFFFIGWLRERKNKELDRES